MRLELFILGATLFFMYNTYHEGKYINMLFGYKKYYAMALYFLLGVGLITILRRNPQQGKAMIYQANSMIKYLPFEKHAKTLISPMLDLTHSMSSSAAAITTIANNNNVKQIQIGTKRSVSETKKKFVAARQEWKCNMCKNQLDHTFEVDHQIRLEYGGSNEVSNLVALCRNCHGKKTAEENMNMR
jgi:hypothetical protein